jgi:hypothetical protein
MGSLRLLITVSFKDTLFSLELLGDELLLELSDFDDDVFVCGADE